MSINKKGLESVEMWMWLVTGLVAAVLIIGTSYPLISRWIHKTEVNRAGESFDSLEAAITYVCKVGSENQLSKAFVFPDIVSNISIYDRSSDTYGLGNNLCIEIQREDQWCQEIDFCTIHMNTVQFNKKSGLFAVIEKALGKKYDTVLNLEMVKSGTDIIVTWNIGVENI